VDYQHLGFWVAVQVYLLQGQRQTFNLEDQWMSARCLQGFQSWSCYMWNWTVSTQHLYTAAPHTADDEKLGVARKQTKHPHLPTLNDELSPKQLNAVVYCLLNLYGRIKGTVLLMC